MSIWCSLPCPKCKEMELTVAISGGWLRLSCPSTKCRESWIVVLPDDAGREIERQLMKKVTRTEFETDYGKGIRKLTRK